MSDRTVFTMRASRGALRALEEEARRYRVPPRTLAETMLEEGIRMRRHPGVVFADRAGGRDAVLAGHPRLSIWQIAQVARDSRSRAAAARQLSIEASELQRALAYAAEHQEEIEAAIRENDAAFERIQRLYPQIPTGAATKRASGSPRRAAAPR